jgi:hypothetical protein
MTTDARLQELLDHHEIRTLLAEYCHGCDRGDEVQMASVYCEESWDDHGRVRADGKAFSAQMTRELVDYASVCSHLLGQSLIRVQGDTAGAETYFLATVTYPGKASVNQLGGRYVDTLERENGAWKIKKRICIREWSMTVPVEADWLANDPFVGPSMSQDDPSYAALGLTHSGLPKRGEAAAQGKGG